MNLGEFFRVNAKMPLQLPSFAVLLLLLVRAPAGCNMTKLINGDIIYSFCILTSLPKLFFSLLLVLFHFPVLPAISFNRRYFFNRNSGSEARTSLGFGGAGNYLWLNESINTPVFPLQAPAAVRRGSSWRVSGRQQWIP